MRNAPSQREPESRDLAIVALDIKRFSDFTDTERTRIATEFRDCIEAAFAGCLSPLWNERVFVQDGGDGIVTGFERPHLHDIVDRVPSALQRELRNLYQRTRLNVRMRMGIGLGPVQYTPDRRFSIAPNQAIIDACRIADCRSTRLLLENSDEHATYLAVAVTPSVMTSTIACDPRELSASEFVEVRVDIEEKDYHSRAFLHVPSPSGPLLRFGLVNLHGSSLSTEDGDAPLEERIAGVETLWPNAPAAGDQATQIGTVTGDVQDQSMRTGNVSGGVAARTVGDVYQGNSIDQRGSRTWNHAAGHIVSTGNGDVSITRAGRDANRHTAADADGSEGLA